MYDVSAEELLIGAVLYSVSGSIGSANRRIYLEELGPDGTLGDSDDTLWRVIVVNTVLKSVVVEVGSTVTVIL